MYNMVVEVWAGTWKGSLLEISYPSDSAEILHTALHTESADLTLKDNEHLSVFYVVRKLAYLISC